MPIEPARLPRAWMDQTGNNFAYRCTPMNIANTSGWEVKLPISVEIEWNGGNSTNALAVRSRDVGIDAKKYVVSHFGYGVITFFLGWLFRTDPGWAIWARGRPNLFKKGVFPLEGIVETYWLSFPFTMNWRFTEPGSVYFSAGETIAFLTLFPHSQIDAVQPRMLDIKTERRLSGEFETWRDERNVFNAGLKSRDPRYVKEGWDRKYFFGGREDADDRFHVARRRLNDPR